MSWLVEPGLIPLFDLRRDFWLFPWDGARKSAVAAFSTPDDIGGYTTVRFKIGMIMIVLLMLWSVISWYGHTFGDFWVVGNWILFEIWDGISLGKKG